MNWVRPTSPSAAATRRRRAGAAWGSGVDATAAAPALVIALAPNTNGSTWRTSCQAGTAVSAISAAAYVDSGSPRGAATGRATAAGRGLGPVHALRTDGATAAPLAASTQDPTLIGEVT